MMKAVECLLQRNMTVEIIAPMLANSALALALDKPVEPQEQLRAPMAGDATSLVEIYPGQELQRHHLMGPLRMIEPGTPETIDLVQ